MTQLFKIDEHELFIHHFTIKTEYKLIILFYFCIDGNRNGISVVDANYKDVCEQCVEERGIEVITIVRWSKSSVHRKHGVGRTLRDQKTIQFRWQNVQKDTIGLSKAM